jgi:hypothetical protein
LSASYLARVALANRTRWRTFAGLLGKLPSDLPSKPDHLTSIVVTLNEAAFARFLAYTGHDASHLLRGVPSLTPVTFTRHGEPPSLRVASLRERMLDCPQCRLRRDGAFLDPRLFPLKMACLRHGCWLYRDGSGRLLEPAVLAEITAAQKRLDRLAACRGTDAAVRAYGIARRYLEDEWSAGVPAFWYSRLGERWHRRAEAAALARRTSWLPSWAIHPECTALAVVFASPYWARLALPSRNRRHRLFYQHLLSVLAVGNGRDDIPPIRNFDPLPDAIREQASWGRLLNDPEWGSPVLPGDGRRKIPFIDITDAYEHAARLRQSLPGADLTSRSTVVGSVREHTESDLPPAATATGDQRAGRTTG